MYINSNIIELMVGGRGWLKKVRQFLIGPSDAPNYEIIWNENALLALSEG